MDRHAPSGFEKTVGLLFALSVFGLVAYTIVYDVAVEGPKGRMLFILVALATGGMFAVVPGFLNFSYNGAGVAIRAAGGAAAFAAVLWLGQTWAEAELRAPQPPAAQREAGGEDALTRLTRLMTESPAPAPVPAPAPQVDALSWLAQAMTGNAAVMTVYTGTSACPLTGAWGVGQGTDPETARATAIQYCMAYGGSHACCASTTSVTP